MHESTAKARAEPNAVDSKCSQGSQTGIPESTGEAAIRPQLRNINSSRHIKLIGKARRSNRGLEYRIKSSESRS